MIPFYVWIFIRDFKNPLSMADTRIFVDATSFSSDDAIPLVESLRAVFGSSSIFNVIHTIDIETQLKQWTTNCKQVGVKVRHVVPSISSKSQTDHFLLIQVFTELLCLRKHDREQATVVMVLGPADFNPVVDALHEFVKQTIVCGKQEFYDRYDTSVRFLPYELLMRDHETKSLKEAHSFVESAISKLIVSCPEPLTVTEIHETLVKDNPRYWPMCYGCITTSELLENLQIATNQLWTVDDLLKHLKTSSPPDKTVNSARTPSPRSRSPIPDQNRINKSPKDRCKSPPATVRGV
ncbi:hypothetical protein GEMRC1_011242 [Eukaryota sp. GEM-RC1]